MYDAYCWPWISPFEKTPGAAHSLAVPGLWGSIARFSGELPLILGCSYPCKRCDVCAYVLDGCGDISSPTTCCSPHAPRWFIIGSCRYESWCPRDDLSSCTGPAVVRPKEAAGDRQAAGKGYGRIQARQQ